MEIVTEKGMIVRHLSYDFWITSGALQERTGMGDKDVRNTIRELNHDGYPIVSGSLGFKLAHTQEEIEGYMDSLKSRIKKLAIRLKWLKITRNSMAEGQTKLNLTSRR